jgi:hypothetical protein
MSVTKRDTAPRGGGGGMLLTLTLMLQFKRSCRKSDDSFSSRLLGYCF